MDLEGEVILVITILLVSMFWSIIFYLTQKEINLKTQIIEELKKGNSIVLTLKNKEKQIIKGNDWYIVEKEYIQGIKNEEHKGKSFFITNSIDSFSLSDIIRGQIKIEFKKGE